MGLEEIADQGEWQSKWEFSRSLSGGGQGTTSIVKHRFDSRKGVLKTIVPRWRGDAQAQARMVGEAELLYRLSSKKLKVPELYAWSRDGDSGDPWIVMSYIDGPTLTDFIQINGPLALNEARQLVKALAVTLDQIHEGNVNHRDIKPDNVILEGSSIQSPYIVDFGVAYDLQNDPKRTNTLETFGNEFLRLPECLVYEDDSRRNKVSDVTYLCGMFFYALTGVMPGGLSDGMGRPPHRRPHKGVMPLAGVNARQRAALTALFNVGLSPNVSERYQTVGQLCEAIDGLDSKINGEQLLDGVLDDYRAIVEGVDSRIVMGEVKIKYANVLRRMFDEVMSRAMEPIRKRKGIQVGGHNPGISAGHVGDLLLGDELVPDVPAVFMVVTVMATKECRFSIGIMTSVRGSRIKVSVVEAPSGERSAVDFPITSRKDVLVFDYREEPTDEDIDLLVSSIQSVAGDRLSEYIHGMHWL